jgi:TatD DNase family protein
MAGLIDTHTHLSLRQFRHDREAVIARAIEAGVEAMVEVGVDLVTSRKAVELARSHPRVWATVGIHPHEAKDLDGAALDELRRLAGDERTVAVGEIGLDYHRDLSPRSRQRRAFVEQIALAQELGLPIVVHVREAYRDALDILAAEARGLDGVLHCWSGDIAQARRALDLGFYLGVGGSITYDGRRVGEIVRRVPLTSIVLETDAPYLAPVPHRGGRNEPAYVRYVAEHVARLLGVDVDQIAATTGRAARELFGALRLDGE